MKRLLPVLVAVTVMVAGSSLLLLSPAHAARPANAGNCITLLAEGGNFCVTQCIANLQQTCAQAVDTNLCAQMISTTVLLLLESPLGPLCDATIDAINDFCGCP